MYWVSFRRYQLFQFNCKPPISMEMHGQLFIVPLSVKPQQSFGRLLLQNKSYLHSFPYGVTIFWHIVFQSDFSVFYMCVLDWFGKIMKFCEFSLAKPRRIVTKQIMWPNLTIPKEFPWIRIPMQIDIPYVGSMAEIRLGKSLIIQSILSKSFIAPQFPKTIPWGP